MAMKRCLPSTSAIIPAAPMLLLTSWALSKRSLSQLQFAMSMHQANLVDPRSAGGCLTLKVTNQWTPQGISLPLHGNT